MLQAVVGLLILWILLKNIPDWMQFGSETQWSDAIASVTQNSLLDEEPKGPPPGLKISKSGEGPQREYSGPIKFYRLAASLHGASFTHGYNPINRNVLFAVSNLKSAATLLPMVCEMSRWNRNYVHAAFMGREDIPMKEILEINGIDEEKCPAVWHDARPDYTEYSTDARAESSVAAAMMHIHNFLHPQVAITDDSINEDVFFVKGVRSKTNSLDTPIIEIPKNQWEMFMWITRLDAGSLRSWHKPMIDILIQAPNDSSGGILRLLKSLKDADYAGLKPPRLTIELPSDSDSWLYQYLEKFEWPPGDSNSPLTTNQVTVRRRIANQHATQEDSSIRFLELFYPSSTANSHVLMLSPNAQLSPQYYHYLRYLLLEYKYSSYGEDNSANVMGISLELPALVPDGRTKLNAPKPSDMPEGRYQKSKEPNSPFLWQAPNSHATMFFGDKWAELHSFLTNRVAKFHQTTRRAARPKLVSETLPAWTEYLLEFMQARGYSLLYPATIGKDSLVTIHNELYHAPEEFASKHPAEAEKTAPPKLPDEPFLRAEAPLSKPMNPEPAVMPRSRPLHIALPFEGDLPEVPHLPYLLYQGKIVPPDDVKPIAREYANKFAQEVGGCKIQDGKHRKIETGNAKDLFCFGDEDEDDWEDDVPIAPPELLEDDVDKEVEYPRNTTGAAVEEPSPNV
jgi:hypothetical protein